MRTTTICLLAVVGIGLTYLVFSLSGCRLWDDDSAKDARDGSSLREPSPAELASAREVYLALNWSEEESRGPVLGDSQRNIPLFTRKPWVGNLDEELPKTPDLPFGFGLKLNHPRLLTDRTLGSLPPLKNLTTLMLGSGRENWRDVGLTEVGLKELAKFPNLAKLSFNNVPVTDAGAKELGRLRKLTTLSFSFALFTDAGLKELTALDHLTSLCLQNTAITDAGLKELAAFKNLTSLNLSSTTVTDAGMKDLAALKDLTTLDLENTRVTDAGLKELAGLKNLTTFVLSGPWVTDRTLTELRRIDLLHALWRCSTNGPNRPTNPSDVTALSLRLTEVTDAGLKELVVFKNLTTLDLSATRVTDHGLKELASLRTLASLNLEDTRVTTEGAAELRRLLPNCKIVGR